MITREQAEQTFHKHYDQNPDAIHTPEIRNLQMEEIDAEGIDGRAHRLLGRFDVEETVWRCTFEMHYVDSRLDQFWKEWRKETCYIVEPKPGPRVIDW